MDSHSSDLDDYINNHVISTYLPPFQYPNTPAKDELSVPGPFGPARTHLKEIDASLTDLLKEHNAWLKVFQGVVREIERRRRVLQDQLAINRAFMHPIRMLPPEILSEIFTKYVQASWIKRFTLGEHPIADVLDTNNRPGVLLRVCRLWRAIALNTRRLWKFMDLVDHGADEDLLDYETYLALSRGSPAALRVYARHFLNQPRGADTDIHSSLMLPESALLHLTNLHLTVSAGRTMFLTLQAPPVIVLPSLTHMQISGALTQQQYIDICNRPKFDTAALQQLILSDAPLARLVRLSKPLETLSTSFRADDLSTRRESAILMSGSLAAKLSVQLLGTESVEFAGLHWPHSPGLFLSITKTVTIVISEHLSSHRVWLEWMQGFLCGSFPVLQELTISHASRTVAFDSIIPIYATFNSIRYLHVDWFNPGVSACAVVALQSAFPNLEEFKCEIPPSVDASAFFSVFTTTTVSSSANPDAQTPVLPRLSSITVIKSEWHREEVAKFVDMVHLRVKARSPTVARLEFVVVSASEEEMYQPFLAELATLFRNHTHVLANIPGQIWYNDTFSEPF